MFNKSHAGPSIDRDMEVSAEVHFAQKLASNEKKYRDRALKRLQKFLTIRSTQGGGMSNDDFIKIWKGLHYCMWMQDKPLIQEELSQRVANLLHSFPRLSDSLRFINVFFITEAREWHLIDRFRMDKFMMLFRDVLHEIFLMMSEAGWPLSACEAFSQYLANSLMNEDNPKLPDGLKLHMAGIFMPELRKVSLDKMTGKKMTTLMFPFAAFILKTRKLNLASKVVSQTITPVLRRFGSWPKHSTAKEKQNQTKGSKYQAAEEDTEEEEEDMECEDQEMEEENDRVEKKKDKKYDMTRLLKLMFKMADNKNVHHKNRALFYKIVQSYSSADISFLSLQSTNATKGGGNQNVEEKEDEDDDKDESSIQTILDLGRVGDQEELPKKKRKRKKKGSEVGDSLKTSEKEKVVATVGNQQVDALGDTSSKKRPVKGLKLDFGLNPSAPGKKRRRDSESLEGSEVSVSKKARLVGPDNPNVGSSPKSKTSVGERLKETDNSKVDKKGSKTPRKSDGRSVSPKNKNSNAGPHLEVFKGNLTLHSSIEIVNYPSSSESKAQPGGAVLAPSTFKPFEAESLQGTENDSMTESISVSRASATNSSDSLSVSSMSDIKVFMPSSGDKKARKKKKRRDSLAHTTEAEMEEGSAKEEVDKEKAGGYGLLSVLSTPSHLVQKAMAMVLPASDPGPAKEKIPKEDGTLTPGTKKKVVFDLRKNKANKFKDYLKSLNSESPPVFEPHKSPSQSILKSPLPSPNSSSISLDMDSDSDTPSKKKSTKRAAGIKKAQRVSSSPLRSAKQSPKTSRRTSKSSKKK